MVVFDFALRVAAALTLGAMIGAERQLRQRMAGLRTNALVSVGASLFVMVSVLEGDASGHMRIAAQVVSGIGFLGAGVIMRESGNIRGINTAATLWGVAAVGAASGAGFAMEAVLGALFVLAANTLLRPLVNQINRHPVDNTDTEVTYRVTALIRRTHQKEVLPWLEQKLEQANYPLSELDIEPFGDQDIEISAVLLATSIDGDELDALMKTLGEHPRIKQIFWRASTTD